jgi:tellurite resistance protein TehA-like permease
MTFEWLPIINPYRWPFSFFQILTEPYFAFWAKIFPSVRFENSSVEISAIVGLEALNSLIYFCVRLTNILIVLLEETEKHISSEIQ